MRPLTLKSTKKPKQYKADIKLTPMPKCCTECPFYYMPENEDTWYERWNCYLIDIKDNFGIAVNRHKDCPLGEGMNK